MRCQTVIMAALVVASCIACTTQKSNADNREEDIHTISEINGDNQADGAEAEQLSGEDFKEHVYKFISHPYFNGISLKMARQLTASAIPRLWKVVENQEDRQWWVNAVVTIGFIGDESDFKKLVDKLEVDYGELDGDTYKMLKSIPFAIGCIAGNGHKVALAYLKSHLRPESWDFVRGTYQGKDLGAKLAQRAVIGLAISGQPEAREILVELQKEVASDEDFRGREEMLQKISDGFGDIDVISEKGREGYFDIPNQ